VPAIAIAIARAEQVVFQLIWQQYTWFKTAFKNGELVGANQLKQQDELIRKLQEYLEKITVSDDSEDQTNLLILLRIVVYLKVLRSDLEQLSYSLDLRTQPALYQVALDFMEMLGGYWDNAADLEDDANNQALRNELNLLEQWAKQHHAELRDKINVYAASNHLNAARIVELLAAHRWLERLIVHSQRFVNVLCEKESKQELQADNQQVN